MIVIINGPLGIGKTSVSWALLERFERAGMLDGDYLGAVHPFDLHSPERVTYLYQTLHHLVAFHKAHGYPDLVINYVFETPESLAELRHGLSGLDDVIYAFRLMCDEAELARRIQARAAHEGLDKAGLDWELQRFRQLITIQEANALQGDLGFVINTTGHSPAAVAEAIWDNIHEVVELLPYRPEWAEMFSAEQECIAAALGPLALEIHHIGSTAVPGLQAKPVIDILVAVDRLETAIACLAPLQQLGYTFIDYPQNTDRRFFRKGQPRTHHLHIVAQGSPSYRDHLDFRDALRTHPGWLRQYQELKTELSTRYRNDRATYSERKSALVMQMLAAYRAGE